MGPFGGHAKTRAQHCNDRKWEAVPIGEEFFSDKEFANLISVEVLDDYNIVKDVSENTDGSVTKRTRNETVNSRKVKKVKLDALTQSDSEIRHQIQSPGSKAPWIVTDIQGEEVGLIENSHHESDSSLAWGVGSPVPWIVSEVQDSKPQERGRKKVSDTSLSELRKSNKPFKTKGSKSTNKNMPADVIDSSSESSESINYMKAMQAWVQMGVPLPILRALYENKFQEPTPIQRLTLPSSVLGRKDVVGAAETGSGKTLAFAIPIISGILTSRETGNRESSLQALVLTPTRELAVQVNNHIKEAAKYTNIKTVVIVGGLATQKQERLLRSNPEIVIATPGRLWELVQEGNEHLSSLNMIKFLAIDETDRMVEKGHFQELEGILATINSDPDRAANRQNFIFSATLAFTHEPPQRLKKTSLKASKNKQQTKKVSSKEKLRHIMDLVGVRSDPKIVDITRTKGTCETLTEMQILCQLAQKDYYLYYFFLRHPGRTIVFCNSINCVRRLTNLFFLLKFEPLPLHSDMHQKQRLKNLERFTANDNGILIATDVAARGLDIVDVQHVIHYQVPRTAESYIHRSGRTARAFKGGIAVLFVEPAETTLFRNIMKSLKREETLPVFDTDSKIFREVKERVDMAVKVEKFEHTVRKKFADMNWMDKARKEMDLASSDDNADSDDEFARGNKGLRKNMEQAKKELDLNKRKLDELLSIKLFLSRPEGDVRTAFQKLSKIQTPVL